MATRSSTATREFVHCATVALVLALVYGYTAPRTIATEDDGLFVLASYTLGIPHSPGYPLFTLVGHLFSYLPFGDIPYRIHLASSFFAMATCVLLRSLLRRFVDDSMLATCGAITFGLSELFWGQAIIAEVYTLNAFFFVLTVHLCILVRESGRTRDTATLAFVFGLSLSNHWPLTILISPMYLMLVWPRWRQLLANGFTIVPAFAAGLLPYLWLYFRSHEELLFSHMGPFESLGELWFFVSRQVYADADFNPAVTWLDKARFLLDLAGQLVRQFGLPGFLLGIGGAVVIRQHREFPLLLCLAAGFVMLPASLLVLVDFTFSPIERLSFRAYPHASYAIFAVAVVLGLAAIQRELVTAIPVAAPLAKVLPVALVLYTAYHNFARNDRSGFDFAETHAAKILHALPEGGELFVMRDWSMAAVSYLHLVEGVRPDVVLRSEYATFLPTRLFDYFDTPLEQKQRLLADHVAGAARPAYMLQNPSAFGMAATDDGLLYRLHTDAPTGAAPTGAAPTGAAPTGAAPTSAAPPLTAELLSYYQELVSNPPKDEWTGLHWREIVTRLAVLAGRSPESSLAASFVSSSQTSFWAALGVIRGMLARPEGYDLEQLTSRMLHLESLVPEDDSYALSQLRFMQGRLLIALGSIDEGRRYLEASLRLEPSASNTAREVLAEIE